MNTFPNLPSGAVILNEFTRGAEQANQGISQLFSSINSLYIYPLWAKLVLGFFIFMIGGMIAAAAVDKYKAKYQEIGSDLSAFGGIIIGSLIKFSGLFLMAIMGYDLILYYGFGISPFLFQ